MTACEFTCGTRTRLQPDAWEVMRGEPDELQGKLRELEGIDNGWWCPGTFAAGKPRAQESWLRNESLVVLELCTVGAGAATLTDFDLVNVLMAVDGGEIPWCLYAYAGQNGVTVVGLMSEPVKGVEDYATVVDALEAYLAPLLSTTGLHVSPDSWEPWRPVLAPGAVDFLRQDAEPFEVQAAMAARPEEQPASPLAAEWTPIPPTWLSEPPPKRDYLLRHPTKDGEECAPGTGDGLLPLGKAGCVSSAGGVGKTHLVVQLAISVATGRLWLNHFHVGRNLPNRVLLLLGEEDADEAQRRIHNACNALNLDDSDRRIILESVVVVPLAGEVCPLLELFGRDDVVPTSHLKALREQLAKHDDWGLIVIDPQARFAGVEVETSNALATRFVQECERLTKVSGNPTVLVMAHSSKLSRRDGSADSRGVTGLTDGFRWHATLISKGKSAVEFEVKKNNYGRPCDPIRLERSTEGLLFVETEAQRSQRERASDEGKLAKDEAKDQRAVSTRMTNVRKLLTAMANTDSSVKLSRTGLATLIGVQKTRGLDAVEYAFARALIENVGKANQADYQLTELGRKWLAEELQPTLAP